MLPGAPDGRSTITALLGPTNTGKTHRAVERMLEHDSGMIGLPLRLLAREVYDRITARIGEASVALLTGEEKRVPPRPRYWVCTVEAMPTMGGPRGSALDVDFLAVDEVQLAAHPERGHVFTDRILRARGGRETWFLGSDTMAPLIGELSPTAVVRSHPRLSQLRGAGTTGIGGLPPRSAIVAFSATRVYELAERVRTRRGGTAIVLGALSPRARNAQVAMYQSGEVDFMVATDAVGMGLNLDVGHVAFADLRKFDGREARGLDAAELGQIAGRAGRYLNDGTFGTLAPQPGLSPWLNRSIETHDFAPVRRLYYRNHDLDLRSVDALIASLKLPPPRRCLRPVERAEDNEALLALIARPDIAARARGSEAVSLLWQVCQVPDFRRLMLDDHVGLLAELFLQLTGPSRKLGPDWMRQRVDRIDDTAGDIDILLMRMSFIRTWTYITHQTGWVDDAASWQARARDIEDRLSDALHDRLVQRFVDRGRATRRSARPNGRPVRPVAHAGDGARSGPGAAARLAAASPFAALLALRAQLAPGTPPPHGRERAQAIVDARHDQLEVDADGRIALGGSVVASLAHGRDALHPDIVLAADETLAQGDRARILRRLLAFARDFVDEALGPLPGLGRAPLSAAGRGLVYQLEQSLGTLQAHGAREQIALLTDDDRQTLERAGFHVGSRTVYAPVLLKPRAIARRRALLAAWHEQKRTLPSPPPGRVSLPYDGHWGELVYTAMGYPVFGPRAVRADVAEGVGRDLDAIATRLPLDRKLASRLGCGARESAAVIACLARASHDEGPPPPDPKGPLVIADGVR